MSANPQFPEEHSTQGEFVRQPDEFRDWLSTDGTTPYPVAANRYHLYVSLACPWASRTVIAREVMGLQSIIGMSVVDPVRDERGWAFREGVGHGPDPVNGFSFLGEAYHQTNPQFQGRYTVPVLWDTQSGRIVNNSEDDICRILTELFAPLAAHPVQWFPRELEPEHSQLSGRIYDRINNGVYKAGFSTLQSVYESACRDLFAALDELEARLERNRFLFGNRIVEADWRLFCTLIRFDAVYYIHFKCNVRQIRDYPNLHGYLLDLYQQPGIAGTVNFDHIKRHYYMTHPEINPNRIVPLGPALGLDQPHGRGKLAVSPQAFNSTK